MSTKKCWVCGRFMNNMLHGACLTCLRNIAKLPQALQKLAAKDSFGKERSSIRGVIRASLTLKLDGEWFAVQWDPKGILQKNLMTKESRPYLTPDVVKEIEQIIKEVEND